MTNAILPSGEKDLSCFHTQFEQIVQRGPQESALLFGETIWTYERLNIEANRIAHRLLQETEPCTEQHQFLGVFLQKSSLLIATVLACMKAQRPFLLLDPDYSLERLAFMRQDARILTILTEETMLRYLPEQEGVSLLCLEVNQGPVEHERDLVLESIPSDILCAIYTSGTQGQIKAAYIEHQVLDLLHREQARLYQVSASDRIIQFAAQGYDAFLWEMTMAFLSGATLCLGTKSELEAGPVLSEFLKSRSVSIVSLTPSVLASLPDEDLPDLRVIIAIGEYCPLSLVQRFAPNRYFHNAYGLMEAGICQTSGRCFETDECDPSIGYPLQHVVVRILDADHSPVPDGTFGEIAVGGPAISARGYYNRPELTAQVFIPDPCNASRILCRTGDRGRINEDGSVTITGRLQQNDVFKVNGIRVERQEIERALLQHPLLHGGACHVVHQHYGQGDSRLIAFLVVSHYDKSVSTRIATEIQLFLRTQTPLRVVPNFFVVLDSFPLGPNGKLDENALQRWTFPEEQEVDEYYSSPETETERILVERFARLLLLKRISTTAAYMHLRNSSLSIAFFSTEIYQAFGIRLPLLTIVQNPTIQVLARTIQEHLQRAEPAMAEKAG